MRLETSVLILFFLLGGCISTPIGYMKEAPEGIYPRGELSGEPFHMVGWKFKF